VYNNVVEIPPSLVLKRWTVSAKDGIVSCIPGDVEVAARQADEASMHGACQHGRDVASCL
jgi:hypothetical protein